MLYLRHLAAAFAAMISQNRIELLHGFPIAFIRNRIVNVRRRGNGGMAQPLGNVVELDIVFQHHRRMGVAEGMETAATEFLFAPHIEVPHVIAVHGTAVFTGTDEIAFDVVVAVTTMVLGLLGLIAEQGLV